MAKKSDTPQPPQAKSPYELASEPAAPAHRRLRGFAFDPSLATRLNTAVVSEITYKVPWEKVELGPCGEYVEVIDFDPASNCFYVPIDLDHPYPLARDGMDPSEGSPQFHQQMVYAVVMTTIDRFEKTLGRKALWADRKYDRDDPDADLYVQRLRIYPHALRMANAYYSRDRMSLLFGYFPATEDRSSGLYPGGLVFTCLSHDVIAHETTHALLDGFMPYLMEPTNPEILAFHEAFADIVALFQHFTFPEALAHQIATTRGDLGAENFLGQLATQFGYARGAHGALRDAIGKWSDEEKKWIRHDPDPTELERTEESHGKGAILVAAVFDAFLAIYQCRTKDLLRLATEGSGVLRPGALHPDLVARLAREASKAAGHVLEMCIRALDYCPPVDLNFGEYLRALITADMDLMPEDKLGYRVAFVEAFRRRGIYPLHVRTLSEDSLRWARPKEEASLKKIVDEKLEPLLEKLDLRTRVDEVRYLHDRREIWSWMNINQADIHDKIKAEALKSVELQQLFGLMLDGEKIDEQYKDIGVRDKTKSPKFYVKGLRLARRAKEDGRVLNQAFFTIYQKATFKPEEGEPISISAGSAVIWDLDAMEISYVVRKGLSSKRWVEKVIEFKRSRDESASLAATYFERTGERFAALHDIGA